MHKKPSDIANEAAIAALAAPYKPAERIAGPVTLSFVAVMPRPQSMCAVSTKTGLPLQHPARYRHIIRSDIDNLAKALLDSFKAWWLDDAQVWDLHGMKVVAAFGEQPHWEVTVTW